MILGWTRPQIEHCPRGGPRHTHAPAPRKNPQVGGMVRSNTYFLPWFLTASIAAAAAVGSR